MVTVGPTGQADSTTAQVIISGGRNEKVLGPKVLVVAHKLRGGSLSTFQQD